MYRLIAVAGTPDDAKTWWRALKWVAVKLGLPGAVWAIIPQVDLSEMAEVAVEMWITYFGAAAFTALMFVAGVKELRAASHRIRAADERRRPTFFDRTLEECSYADGRPFWLDSREREWILTDDFAKTLRRRATVAAMEERSRSAGDSIDSNAINNRKLTIVEGLLTKFRVEHPEHTTDDGLIDAAAAEDWISNYAFDALTERGDG